VCANRAAETRAGTKATLRTTPIPQADRYRFAPVSLPPFSRQRTEIARIVGLRHRQWPSDRSSRAQEYGALVARTRCARRQLRRSEAASGRMNAGPRSLNVAIGILNRNESYKI
jgi:hypothetical protein